MRSVRFYALADRRSLGLFRIALGLLLCADLVARLGLIETLYTNEGVLTNHFALYRPVAPQHLSFFYALSLARDVRVLVVVTFAVVVLFTLGYRTRLTLALALVLVISLHARNLLAEVPSDPVIHAWMFWALLLPVGDRLSLDGLCRAVLARPRAGELDDPAPSTARSSLAVAGAQLWLLALHAAITLRHSGPLWREGQALAYALGDVTWTTPLGAALGRSTPGWWLRPASYIWWLSPLVIALLIALPWRRARWAALIYMLVFHLLSSLLFRDVLLDVALAVGAPLLLTAEDWERWIGGRARARDELVVIFDGGCGVCFVICRVLHRLDLWRRLRFLPSDSTAVPPTLPGELLASTVVVLRAGDDRPLTRAAAVAAIIASLPGGAPLAWFLRRPVVARSADRGYTAFAQRRARVSQWIGFAVCGVPQPGSGAALAPTVTRDGRAAARVLCEASALLLAFICGNALVRAGDSGPPARGTALDVPARYARLAVLPDRLAPEPPRSAGVMVIDGLTPSGAHLDPVTGRAPLTAPTRGTSGPLRAYFERMHQSRHAVYIEGLRDYVKRVAASSSASERVDRFEIVWLEAPIVAPGEEEPPSQRTRLGGHP